MTWAIVGFALGWTFHPSNFKNIVALVPRMESQHEMARDTSSDTVYSYDSTDSVWVVPTPKPTPGVSHD